ncbi:MAG TPA: hypothetical protein VE093_16655 [Polyangiaceae bacterium]|nr:hypothetical protein [Polyangiaceae bacterium]
MARARKKPSPEGQGVRTNKPGSPTPPPDHAEPALVGEVERAVRQAGALPLGKLTRAKLTKKAQADLLEQLVARGLERRPKAVRVPIEEQLAPLVVGGGRVPLKDVPRRVKGATKAEINAALGRLVRADKLRVVVRTQVEVLVGGADRTLEPPEMASLVKLHADLTKTLKKVAAKGLPRTLLREDLAPLLDALERAARPPKAQPAREIVDDALRRMEDPALKLVRIPDLVRSLKDRLPVPDIHRALSDAATRGAIELRPEAGGEFLEPDDARLCPPGPRGSVFSYARLLSP